MHRAIYHPKETLGLLITLGLDLVVLELLHPLLAELPVCTPAQKEERHHDENAAEDGRGGERHSGAQPVDDGDEENRQQ